MELILGGVYKTKWDERPFRVLAFDNSEVFYDCFWPSLNQWTFASSLKRKGYYYRMSLTNFIDQIEFIREQDLTEIEKTIFLPKLPFRICQYENISWEKDKVESIEKYEIITRKCINDFKVETVLEVPEIIIYPFGSKGGITKPFLIKSMNSKSFTNLELMWNANNLQSEYLRGEVKSGIGIYRLGHEKKLASYYLGNYKE